MNTLMLWLLVAVPQGSGAVQEAAPIAHYASHMACAEGVRFHARSGLYTQYSLVCYRGDHHRQVAD